MTIGDDKGFKSAAVGLKKDELRLKQFCKDNGRKYKPDRTAVPGYNKSISAKATAENKKILTNATGKPIIEVKSNSLTGPANSITQRNGAKGNIDRNYYDDNGVQFKQISNTDHGHKSESGYGDHGEHAHDYIYDNDGNLIDRPSREINTVERKENSDIL